VFIGKEGYCFYSPLPVFTEDFQNSSAVSNDITFLEEQEVPQILSVSIVPGNATQAPHFQKQKSLYCSALYGSVDIHLLQSSHCANVRIGSNKDYLLFIYPSHNFW